MMTFTNTQDSYMRSARLATAARHRQWVFKAVAAVFIGAGLYAATIFVPALSPLLLPVGLVALAILCWIDPASEIENASYRDEHFGRPEENTSFDESEFNHTNSLNHVDHSWGVYSDGMNHSSYSAFD